MDLTKSEEALINTLREIDKQNPLSIDGYTTEFYIDFCIQMLSGCIEEAARRYRLFKAESKKTPLIDLTEAQRHKERFEDVRAPEAYKKEYELIYKSYNLPAPIWIRK